MQSSLLGRASPHDPDTPLLNPGLWAVSWTLSYHCPPSAGCWPHTLGGDAQSPTCFHPSSSRRWWPTWQRPPQRWGPPQWPLVELCPKTPSRTEREPTLGRAGSGNLLQLLLHPQRLLHWSGSAFCVHKVADVVSSNPWLPLESIEVLALVAGPGWLPLELVRSSHSLRSKANPHRFDFLTVGWFQRAPQQAHDDPAPLSAKA